MYRWTVTGQTQERMAGNTSGLNPELLRLNSSEKPPLHDIEGLCVGLLAQPLLALT